jgi:hypothetical protein
MASQYSKVFTNPYPSGWENLPSVKTPIIAQALQQHTNAIEAIEAFLDSYPMPTKLSDLENDSILPTKVSDLINDLGFVTSDKVPKKLSQMTNDLEFITAAQIPQNLSDYINDIGFITTAVNSLLNYYLKSETYSKNEINNLFNRVKQFDVKVVNELPLNDISDTTIYCIPKSIDNVDLVNDNVLDIDSNKVDDTDNYINTGTQVFSEIEIGGLPNA